jgi:hypothetical protein
VSFHKASVSGKNIGNHLISAGVQIDKILVGIFENLPF